MINEGALTREEEKEMEEQMADLEKLSIENARILAQRHKANKDRRPSKRQKAIEA